MVDSITMHGYALDKALKDGPQEFNICGEVRMAYGLTKKDLKELFFTKGYNTSTGVRWRTSILEWLDYFNDKLTIRDPNQILNKKESLKWSVVFYSLDRSDLTALKMKAEDVGIPPWPKQEMWDRVAGETY